ncbi:alpha/beta hydrolase [soil metagenome]
MSADAQDWFDQALARPFDRLDVVVDGARIAYRAWGKPDAPCVVLVHGGAAHSGWWDHVAPYISNDQRVVALDLSGHGDSDHREAYSLEQWAKEVMAVAGAQASTAPPIVFGHSMGGFVALTAGMMFGTELLGVLAIDSPVREMSAETREVHARGGKTFGARVYPTKDEIVARFRTVPPDASTLAYVCRHIAEQSVHEVEGGWTWKFDAKIFLRSYMEPADIAEVACHVALIRGERGIATTDLNREVIERLGGHVPISLVPNSGHHIMLDQPIALIAALLTLTAQWRAR